MLTLLLVDDTPENLTVLGTILQPLYRVRVANSGRRALEIANTIPPPDLILLDVMMPEMDGHEVLRQLRKSPATATIPVIFVTAMDGDEDEELGLGLGAVDYITKPVKPSIVLARIRTHLELKQARDVLADTNHYLEQELQRRMRELTLVQDISMRALAGLAETRDNETGHHIRRTQLYVEALATQLHIDSPYRMQLNSERITLLGKAAPLHDIGKVGIPDHILLKPGPLNADEWAIMQTHAKLGGDAIERAIQDEGNHAPLAFLHVAMDIAYYHHERWDGTGYPDGLSGIQIPLAARIMAVADVFDALISNRVYKRAMPPEQARAIILDGSGRQFDPVIVTAFTQIYGELVAIANRYSDPLSENRVE
jgi:putative two-component system response regulator